jgi:hypothetical protein
MWITICRPRESQSQLHVTGEYFFTVTVNYKICTKRRLARETLFELQYLHKKEQILCEMLGTGKMDIQKVLNANRKYLGSLNI